LNLKISVIPWVFYCSIHWKNSPALIAGLFSTRFFKLWGQDFPALRARKLIF
jgi:hypothetical protein